MGDNWRASSFVFNLAYNSMSMPPRSSGTRRTTCRTYAPACREIVLQDPWQEINGFSQAASLKVRMQVASALEINNSQMAVLRKWRRQSDKSAAQRVKASEVQVP
jgi:hypothetical protein